MPADDFPTLDLERVRRSRGGDDDVQIPPRPEPISAKPLRPCGHRLHQDQLEQLDRAAAAAGEHAAVVLRALLDQKLGELTPETTAAAVAAYRRGRSTAP